MSKVNLKSDYKMVRLLTCNFVPFGCLMVAQLHFLDEVQSHGGLIMPDGSKDLVQSPTATILAVGPECKQVKPWDEIVMASGAQGAWITHDGQQLMVLREDSIMGIVEKNRESRLHKSLLAQRESKSISLVS